jgi:hypothetical protein
MEIKTCKFIDASDLFVGCPDAWQMFMDSDPAVTWGDASRTLVSPEFMDFSLNDLFSDDNQITRQIELVLNKIKTLDFSTYIDLEN